MIQLIEPICMNGGALALGNTGVPPVMARSRPGCKGRWDARPPHSRDGCDPGWDPSRSRDHVHSRGSVLQIV